MALEVNGKINQFGIQESYWRILSIKLNLQYGYCDITLGGYASQETRDNGAEPMNIKTVRAKWDDVEFYKFFSPEAIDTQARAAYSAKTTRGAQPQIPNIYNIAYSYIKERDEYFSNAGDLV